MVQESTLFAQIAVDEAWLYGLDRHGSIWRMSKSNGNWLPVKSPMGDGSDNGVTATSALEAQINRLVKEKHEIASKTHQIDAERHHYKEQLQAIQDKFQKLAQENQEIKAQILEYKRKLAESKK